MKEGRREGRKGDMKEVKKGVMEGKKGVKEGSILKEGRVHMPTTLKVRQGRWDMKEGRKEGRKEVSK
jgi:hypothetical protein